VLVAAVVELLVNVLLEVVGPVRVRPVRERLGLTEMTLPERKRPFEIERMGS
jgi:hypothetical protein